MDSNTTPEVRTDVQELNAFQKVVGVIVSPGKTFASIALNPNWIVPVLIFMLMSLVFSFAASDIIKKEALKQQVEKMEEQGMDQEQIDQAVATTEKFMKYGTYFSSVVFPLILILIIAGVFLFVGNVALGGSATYKKVLAVTAYSSLVMVVGSIITLPIVLVKDSIQVSFSLATLFFAETGKSFVYHFLAKIEVFTIWWMAVYAIGLAAIYKMKTQKMATAVVTVYIIYAVVASAITAAFA